MRSITRTAKVLAGTPPKIGAMIIPCEHAINATEKTAIYIYNTNGLLACKSSLTGEIIMPDAIALCAKCVQLAKTKKLDIVNGYTLLFTQEADNFLKE